MQTVALTHDQPAGQAALALAGFLRDPLSGMSAVAQSRMLENCATAFGGGRIEDAAVMADLVADPLGRAAATRATQTSGLLDDVIPDVETLQSLQVSQNACWGVMWALAPWPRIEELCRFIAGAICTARLRGLLLRQDRELASALLGAAAYDFGLYQSQPFYSALAALDDGASFVPSDEDPFLKHPVGQRAVSVFAAGIGRDAPLATRLLGLRLTGQPQMNTPVLSEGQATQLKRLIDAKGPTR